MTHNEPVALGFITPFNRREVEFREVKPVCLHYHHTLDESMSLASISFTPLISIFYCYTFYLELIFRPLPAFPEDSEVIEFI